MKDLIKILNKWYLISLGLLLPSLLQAQTSTPVPRPRPRPPVVRPPIPSRINPSQLGSSAQASQIWRQDLASLVKEAMPSYSDASLAAHFKVMKEKYARGGPGAKFDVGSLKQLFMMELREGEGETEKASYSFYPEIGQAIITKDLFTGNLLSQEQAKAIIPGVQNQHRELLARLSIGADQVYASKLRLRNVDLGKDAGNGRVASEGSPQVEGFLTYVSRSVDGIIVEGSHLKIFSHDEKALAGLSAQWPRFVWHPEINAFDLKSKGQLQEEIVSIAKKSLNPKHEYNVKLAVVLRPAMLHKQKVFIPALKVGIYSKPPGTDEKSILNGEAGEKFFVNLVKQPLNEELSNSVERSE